LLRGNKILVIVEPAQNLRVSLYVWLHDLF